MSRELTSSSRLENLKREAKRWLKALRAGDATARARLAQWHPSPPPEPTLRDVHLAFAREFGLAGWAELKRAVAAIEAARAGSEDARVREYFQAAGRGDVDAVRALLDAHPDLLNVREDGDNATPLHFAAERGDMAMVRLLVERGIDTDGDGTVHELNALGWAVCWDYVHNVEVAEYLLAHGAPHTIHTAVALGDVDALRRIVAADPSQLERRMDRTNKRRHPLHLAVVKGQLPALLTLLELGADPNADDASALTPLDQATIEGKHELVEALLAHGAEPRLPAAVVLGRDADVRRLLASNADLLKPGQRYGTLIVHAARYGSGAMMRALIRAGADPNARDDVETAVDQAVGYTALHAAAFHGNLAAAEALLEAGADPNVRESKWRSTPAGWADYAGHPAVRDRILAARIDLFQCIDFDRADRIPEIVRQSYWLLEKRFRDYADFGTKEDAWWPEPWHTPLAWAVMKNRLAAARALLEHGALQPLAPDGRTLAQIARGAGHEEMAVLLDAHRRVDVTQEGRVRWFIRNACPDHRVRSAAEHAVVLHTAARLLHRHPEIASDSFWTRVVCGDVDGVRRALDEDPGLARARGGPNDWTALLYLCFTRLPGAGEHAVEIARLLLDRGADPNAYFMAGDSRYTPMVGAIGEGEEHRPGHARRDDLVELLLDRGAEPYDTQVLYNLHFDGDSLWWLRRIHAASVRRGRAGDWDDPEWHMLDMGPYGTGAAYVLGIADRKGDRALREWATSHGANPAGHRPLTDDPFADMDVEAVRALVALRPELLQSTHALFAAVRRDRADIVALLLDLGAPIEIEDEHRHRLLHEAAFRNAMNVARLLIERGAEIDPRETQWGNTPLDFAVWSQHAVMIDLLAPHSRDIWNLVFIGNVERVRQLLEEQPELARLVHEGHTPLTWLPDDEEAAVEIVKLFLERGADPSVRDAEGMTAADRAARRGLLEAAAVLSGG